MFHHLTGTLSLPSLNTAVIDCGGVGFLLSISAVTHSRLSANIGRSATLYTYMSVREDALELFGFHSEEELSVFRMLLSVSGVGPKAAMSILSILPPESFATAVIASDAKAISKAQGVGAKTAARIILELRDKLAKEFPGGSEALPLDSVSGESSVGGSIVSDAANALIVLGYSRQEAYEALKGLKLTNMTLDDAVRAALKKFLK